MEMRYFYFCDIVKHKEVQVNWHPGQENIGEYASKHHDTKHHQQVVPIYLHETNSSQILPWATNPSVLRGYVGTIPVGYICGLTLPINVGTTTPVPQIITQVAPVT